MQSLVDYDGILVAKRFAVRRWICHVEACDLRDGDGVGIAGKQLDFVTGGDFTLARDGDVETGAGAREKALDHLVGLKTDAQLVARKARLRDQDFSGTYGEAVAEMHGIFEQAFGGEVLSENGKRQIAAGQLLLPVGIVLQRIAVNRFVFAAVCLEVSLAVAIEI